MIHNDHLDTPQKMTDASGTVVWSAVYKPFGEATITVSTITNNLRFPGQYYDGETGLNENWWRFYNAVIGRYLQADPLGQRGGLNLFNYAHNNPLRFIDPNGLYGTSSCTYYEQACQTNGSTYECKIVQKACNFFPKDSLQIRRELHQGRPSHVRQGQPFIFYREWDQNVEKQGVAVDQDLQQENQDQ
jgi:RHS repeat-associated protein